MIYERRATQASPYTMQTATTIPPHDLPTALPPLRIVIIGLTITSSWGNGHATTFRGLVRELVRRGHDVLFLEHDKPWYASNRDCPKPPFGRTELYASVADLRSRFAADVHDADAVIVGSYVPEGVAVGEWATGTAGGVTAFYDIDTPVTLAKLEREDYEYLAPHLIPRYDLYLSFTGGPTLTRLEKQFHSPRAVPLYCSVDPDLYFPEPPEPREPREPRGGGCKWHLGYLGTYSDDRQPPLEKLMLDAARQWPQGKFVVAGPQYPDSIKWPANVQRIHHLPPAEHRRFYNEQAFTLNLTRADMIKAGYSPSVRLFEAAACGAAIISDRWEGIETILEPDKEIFLADSSADVLRLLRELGDEARRAVARRARKRILARHTAAHRALELETYITETLSPGSRKKS